MAVSIKLIQIGMVDTIFILSHGRYAVLVRDLVCDGRHTFASGAVDAAPSLLNLPALVRGVQLPGSKWSGARSDCREIQLGSSEAFQ